MNMQFNGDQGGQVSRCEKRKISGEKRRKAENSSKKNGKKRKRLFGNLEEFGQSTFYGQLSCLIRFRLITLYAFFILIKVQFQNVKNKKRRETFYRIYWFLPEYFRFPLIVVNNSVRDERYMYISAHGIRAFCQILNSAAMDSTVIRTESRTNDSVHPSRDKWLFSSATGSSEKDLLFAYEENSSLWIFPTDSRLYAMLFAFS